MPEGVARILFTPSGRQGETMIGTSVLDAARDLGVDLDSICGGRGLCGRCQIRLGSSKSIPLDESRLSKPGPTELKYHGRRPLEEHHRLGCATQILGDVVIDVPFESQVHHQVVRKRPEVADIDVDPVVRLFYVEVPEPGLGAADSDDQKLRKALSRPVGNLRRQSPRPLIA